MHDCTFASSGRLPCTHRAPRASRPSSVSVRHGRASSVSALPRMSIWPTRCLPSPSSERTGQRAACLWRCRRPTAPAARGRERAVVEDSAAFGPCDFMMRWRLFAMNIPQGGSRPRGTFRSAGLPSHIGRPHAALLKSTSRRPNLLAVRKTLFRVGVLVMLRPAPRSVSAGFRAVSPASPCASHQPTGSRPSQRSAGLRSVASARDDRDSFLCHTVRRMRDRRRMPPS